MTNNANPAVDCPIPWPMDALDRKPLADYLTKSLTTQSYRLREQERGLTISLDAPWGAGKTFFVKHWIDDLRQANHPIVYFDAWENDIGDEASVALMAVILADLKAWKDRIPKANELADQAKKFQNSAVKNLRKTVIPALGIVAKGLIQKGTGIAIDKVVETITDTSDDDGIDIGSSVDKILDKLFEKSLKEHESRKENLETFKNSLHSLINLITENTDAKLPVFIFIDELDRCRPPYAIKLLEEIKHIFGIMDVIFIISTNLTQLSNSVKSIYGNDFDGSLYLKRLFDREYVLPAPDNEKFAQTLIAGESTLTQGKAYAPLPRVKPTDQANRAFSLITTAFNFDLRSQKQLILLIEEAFLPLSMNSRVHVIWLFFLCGLFYKDKNFLNQIAEDLLSASQFNEKLDKLFSANPKIPYSNRQHGPAETSIAILIRHYHTWSLMDINNIDKEANNSQAYEYPYSIAMDLMRDLNGRSIDFSHRHDIAQYANVVRSAGFVINQASQ